MIVFLTHYPDYVVTIHRMHGELTSFHIIRVTAVIYYKEIVVSYAEAVDRYPLL